MNRIIVAGARGFFGSAIVRMLHAEGCTPLRASRRNGGDLIFDVEDRAAIRMAIRPGDVIIDAAGPFQTRTAALLDEAISIGADVVDVSDSLAYARLALTRDGGARDRGVRVLNACSSVSVLSACAIAHSGIQEPAAIHGFLAPAARYTAHRGAAESLVSCVGRSIAVRRAGELQHARGWIETREFTALGRTGHLTEMADALTLPRAYPSLRDVDFWVDPNTRGAATLLGGVARMPALLPVAVRFARYGTAAARKLGSKEGVLAYEIADAAGARSTIVFSGSESFLMAAIPARLAAVRLARGGPLPAGVVSVDQHVDTHALAAALARHGISIERRGDPAR